jgi:hypothetical protein
MARALNNIFAQLVTQPRLKHSSKREKKIRRNEAQEEGKVAEEGCSGTRGFIRLLELGVTTS